MQPRKTEETCQTHTHTHTQVTHTDTVYIATQHNTQLSVPGP